jgi:hypothetical protein
MVPAPQLISTGTNGLACRRVLHNLRSTDAQRRLDLPGPRHGVRDRPDCHILPVEANIPTITNFGTAVNTAVNLGASWSPPRRRPEERQEEHLPQLLLQPSRRGNHRQHWDNRFGIPNPPLARASPRSAAPPDRDTSARGWSEAVWNRAGRAARDR